MVEGRARELTRVDPDVTDTLPIMVHILQGPPQLLSTDVTSPSSPPTAAPLPLGLILGSGDPRLIRIPLWTGP